MNFLSRLIARLSGRALHRVGRAWIRRQRFAFEGKAAISAQSSPVVGLSALYRAVRARRATSFLPTRVRMPSVRGKPGDLRQAAESRARHLLISLLNARQRADFQSYGYFVVTMHTGRIFCVLPRFVFNVVDLCSGDRYCCMPEVDIPLADLMLAQKLLLESDPETFFAVANRNSDYMGESVASRPHVRAQSASGRQTP